MKTSKLKWVLPFLFLFIFSGCDDEFGVDDWAYVGYWASEKYVLEIWEDGDAYLTKFGRYDYPGWVKIKDRKIVFHAYDDDFIKRLTINQEPSVDEFGFVYMVLDRKRFTKH